MSTSAQPPVTPGEATSRGTSISPVDVALGVSGLALGAAAAALRKANGAVLEPVARVALRPRVVPRQLHPAQLVGFLGRQGAEVRSSIREELFRRLDVLVPLVLAEVLRRARLNEMLVRYVDLDDVVAAVDLDVAAARLDVDAVVRRVDVEAVVKRVDVDSVVSRADVDAIARRLDLDAVLDRIDLTGVVLQRVDLGAVVEAVLDRIDLAGLAEEVIDAVDLPEIIRESTGSMASDTVRGARMQGIAADEAVGRAVDRLLLRRGRRSTEVPGAGASAVQHDEQSTRTQTDRTQR